jgi:excisionase family DNA binding protein
VQLERSLLDQEEHMDALLLKVEEAARRLGLSRSKCYGLVSSGELRSVRLGDQIRVPVGELDQWIHRKLEKGAHH